MQINTNYYQHGINRPNSRSAGSEIDGAGTKRAGIRNEEAKSAESVRRDSFEKTVLPESSADAAKLKELQERQKSPETKSGEWTPDLDKVAAMKADLARNVSAFKQMVQAMLQKQGFVVNGSLEALIQIDEQTQVSAQEAISEDGYWGVDKTSERIIDFAKALSGGDPSKASLLRDAVLSAFAEAEQVWGSALPEICTQTRDRVMAAFDEWENPSGNASENPPAAEDAEQATA